jgi:hypothetical protein
VVAEFGVSRPGHPFVGDLQCVWEIGAPTGRPGPQDMAALHSEQTRIMLDLQFGLWRLIRAPSRCHSR